MAFKRIQSFLYLSNFIRVIQFRNTHLNAISCCCVRESHEDRDPMPSGFYVNAFSELSKVADLLRGLDFVDGRLIDIRDNSKVIDDFLVQSMHNFKSLGMACLGSLLVQEMLKKGMIASLEDAKYDPPLFFNEKTKRKPISINCLPKVYNILNVSAQQKKFVRLAICPQVTQYKIWTGALEDILNDLKSELDFLNNFRVTKRTKMGQQIVVSCLKFLENAITYDLDSSSWMRLQPTKVAETPSPGKWKDFLDIFDDLIKCLKNDNEFVLHVTRLENMREGLLQIKDIVHDKTIGYRETRRQQSLVQKKLTKALGHSSQCLFTLLVYYLYGSVRNVEVELCHWFPGDADKFCLCVGKILTSGEEKMIRNGMKQLDKVLGLFKFIWETAEMEGVLELQGHLWCVGAENRSLVYRGNVYVVHKVCIRSSERTERSVCPT